MNKVKLILFFFGIVSTLNAQNVKVYNQFKDFEKDFITNAKKQRLLIFGLLGARLVLLKYLILLNGTLLKKATKLTWFW